MEFLLGKKDSTKQLIFSTLTTEYPLKLITLKNYIKRRYGKDITFQAVRKAVLELVEEGVLKKENQQFKISKDWARENKHFFDTLYTSLSEEKKRKQETIENVSTYTFSSLNELMIFWQDLIDEWFKKHKGKAINCYQAAHAWEGLLHLDRERTLMGQLKKKGVKSHIVSTGNTPLDKNIRKFYHSLGIDMSINPSTTSFDKAYYVGTYGSMIIQTRYPEKLVKLLDEFFKKNTDLETFNLKELSEIVNKKIPLTLTVIKNKDMAEHINNSILSQV